ncbi:MmgE/PrpD family protein [Acuticoccus sp.]|uniref:MmgE/PrpD family protein n=1 Tax=Acuticoccus sp. TaxID=1904378 RepID=UPI003B525309
MNVQLTDRDVADATATSLDAAPPIARRLADFAAELTFEDVPAEVVERAKRHVLDTVGIALAASQGDYAMRVTTAIDALAGPGPHAVIGRAGRLPLRDAALVNGTLIHGLDYDDTHSEGVVHASASALPVALGVGEAARSTGREALLAYLIGIEASARLGAAAGGAFHQRGFHPTGVVGIFGAALAAGRLRDATPAAMAAAQGVALSMAAGSLEFLEDGSWTKRMHPGWAASSAITALELARNGFKAPPAAYEGRFGLYASHVGEDAADLSRCTEALGTTWEMMNVALKPYPACHFNHAFADAALALREAHGLTPADIRSVRALIGAGQVGTVCEPEASKRTPANAYDAQFSVHYIIATAIARGRFTLDELEEEAIRDPEVLGLTQRITYEVDPDTRFPRYYSGEVVVETTDGRTLSHREDVNRGSDANPLSEADVIAKFHDNAARAIGRRAAERIVDLVMRLEDLHDVSELADALAADRP